MRKNNAPPKAPLFLETPTTATLAGLKKVPRSNSFELIVRMGLRQLQVADPKAGDRLSGTGLKGQLD